VNYYKDENTLINNHTILFKCLTDTEIRGYMESYTVSYLVKVRDNCVQLDNCKKENASKQQQESSYHPC
jgi:hypothetical protein